MMKTKEEDEKIAEVKDQIKMLRVDIDIIPKSQTKTLRQDLKMVKDYLKRLQEED